MEIFTSKEAAEYLGVTQATVKNYLKHGRLTPLRKIGRFLVFTREELDRVKALPKHAGGRPRKKPPEG